MSAPTQRPKVTAHEARQTAEAARERDWHKPSFAKELFLGRFRLDLVHPHPLPADEDVRRGEAFLAALREFCETRIDGARIEREARVPDETITGLKELGALGMKIDRKYGGLGLTQLYYNRALALVGSASPAVGALLSAHQSIGVPQPLKLFGTQEQKDAFLPRLARTDISAFLLTEPDVGSDPARLATSAVPDGDSYVLDGVKLWTTNGVIADLLVVMARVPASDGHPGGITAFVVEADSPGITVEHRNAFMGLRGLENGVTRFHGVRVPAANRIGPEGAGLKIALTTLNTGRLSLPAACAGAGKWCLRIAREWAGVREQWGGRGVQHPEQPGAPGQQLGAARVESGQLTVDEHQLVRGRQGVVHARSVARATPAGNASGYSSSGPGGLSTSTLGAWTGAVTASAASGGSPPHRTPSTPSSHGPRSTPAGGPRSARSSPWTTPPAPPASAPCSRTTSSSPPASCAATPRPASWRPASAATWRDGPAGRSARRAPAPARCTSRRSRSGPGCCGSSPSPDDPSSAPTTP